MLAEKLNMTAEDAERWIVNLIRNARLDAKIDSQQGHVVMATQTVSPYQQLIEKTKMLSVRSQKLAADIEKKLNVRNADVSLHLRFMESVILIHFQHQSCFFYTQILFIFCRYFYRLLNGGTMTSKESNSMAHPSHYVFGASCSLCRKDGFNKGFGPVVFIIYFSFFFWL
jgi:hypothetical protein